MSINLFGSFAKLGGFICFFPRDIGIVDFAEVAVVCGLGINRVKKVKLFDDVGRFEAEDIGDRLLNLEFLDVIGAKVSMCTLTGLGWPMA